MISRREVLSGGLVAAAAGAPGTAAAAGGQSEEVILVGIARELGRIREAMALPGAASVARIRDARKLHLKNTGRFPDSVDVGVDVFEGVLDWLLAQRVPVDLSRTPDGRYFVTLLGTQVILRSDYPDNHVGQGYDR